MLHGEKLKQEAHIPEDSHAVTGECCFDNNGFKIARKIFQAEVLLPLCRKANDSARCFESGSVDPFEKYHPIRFSRTGAFIEKIGVSASRRVVAGIGLSQPNTPHKPIVIPVQKDRNPACLICIRP